MKSLIYLLALFCLSSFTEIPKQHEKKIHKEVLTVFEIESFEKELVEIPSETKAQLSEEFNCNSFYRIKSGEEELGYFYFGKAPSKADDFDFVILFDPEFIIKKVKILTYREDYGGEISSKRWLRQFSGLSSESIVAYGDEIKGISGATISAVSMTNAVNDILENIKLIQANK